MNAEARLSSRDVDSISEAITSDESYEDTFSEDSLCEVMLEADIASIRAVVIILVIDHVTANYITYNCRK